MLYTVVAMIAMCLFASLAVDLARVQVAKTELQAAADAAARYGAVGLHSTMLGTSGSYANAAAVFAENRVDGATASFNSGTDLQFGTWSSSTKTFTTTADPASANAVRITASMTFGSSPHLLTFLSMFGRSATIHATSIATVTSHDTTTAVSAKGNPWLAGMPSGTVCTDFRTSSSEWDTAGSAPNVNSSPALVTLSPLGISGGMTMTFDGVTGGTNFAGSAVNSDADGDASLLVNLGSPAFGDYSNYTTAMNGMSNCHAPINAMMAVFLNDSLPTSTAAPSPLDFSTPTSRDFTSLSPQLKQVFFVGDGRKSNGEVQQFVVPAGATRLFIANMDGWQYNNNVGGYNLSVHATQTVSTVYAR